jgi:hypothetical protein
MPKVVTQVESHKLREVLESHGRQVASVLVVPQVDVLHGVFELTEGFNDFVD